jgi:hypothetical protein
MITKAMKRAAADLIWSASAKVTREERAEVIRRLPPLLKTLREGMGHAGVPVQTSRTSTSASSTTSLAAAFTAKAAVIPHERLEELMDASRRWRSCCPKLPTSRSTRIDGARPLRPREFANLEVVGEGGSMPTPAMLSWARELQVGSWYMLDYRNRNEAGAAGLAGHAQAAVAVRLAAGRGILFQQHRLAPSCRPACWCRRRTSR